jgi:phosphomevalonate kinase
VIEKSLRLTNKSHVKWLSNDIKSAMNRRDFLNKKFNKLKSNGFIDNEYKYVRNTVVKLIRISKREYFSSLIENCETNVWDVIKEVVPTKKQQ